MLSEGRVVADARGNIVDEDDPKQAFVVAARAGKPIPKQYEAAYKAYQAKKSPKNEPVTRAATTPEQKPDPGTQPPAREETVRPLDLKGGAESAAKGEKAQEKAPDAPESGSREGRRK